MKEITKLKTLKDFLNHYGKYYPKEAIDFILANFNDECDADIVLQIRSKLGLIAKENDLYDGFLNNLKQYNLNRGDILEVASGFYPILAEKIAESSEVSSVTAVDPCVIPSPLEKVKTARQLFKLSDSIEKYSCLVALKPCEATIRIIKNAYIFHKPFTIGLCGCTHFTYINSLFPPSYDNWERQVESVIKDNLEENADVYVDHLDDRYNYPYKVFTKIYRDWT